MRKFVRSEGTVQGSFFTIRLQNLVTTHYAVKCRDGKYKKTAYMIRTKGTFGWNYDDGVML